MSAVVVNTVSLVVLRVGNEGEGWCGQWGEWTGTSFGLLLG
jgi:hypothetical protein